MLGIIFCGGQSSRMGRDKGLLEDGNSSWAQMAVEKIGSLGIPVKLSVNKEQLQDYSELFAPENLIRDDQQLAVRGPLLGLLSSHQQFPAEDLFIMACDMPLMTTAMLNALYAIYKSEAGKDAYVFTNDKEPEPLCAIYTATGLTQIIELSLQGSLSRHSMKFVLDQLSVDYYPLREDQKKYFRNFNTHSELNGL